jgi:uncharacterized protein (DUF427 family)
LDPARRRLRARLAGDWLFDTLDACLFYEKGQHPIYAIPVALLAPTMLEPAGRVASKRDSDGQWWSLRTGDEVRRAVVRTWPTAPADLPALKDYAAVETAAVDAWFEEDTEIFYRPRDPYRRVDVLESSRWVRVEVDSVVVAETRRPRLVLETGLPEQWYIPRSDIDWAYLSASEMQSYCQYKGRARYWDVTLGGQTYAAMAWSYEEAIVAAADLAGLVGFPRTHASVKTFVNDELLNQTAYSPDWHSPSLAVGKHP